MAPGQAQRRHQLKTLVDVLGWKVAVPPEAPKHRVWLPRSRVSSLAEGQHRSRVSSAAVATPAVVVQTRHQLSGGRRPSRGPLKGNLYPAPVLVMVSALASMTLGEMYNRAGMPLAAIPHQRPCYQLYRRVVHAQVSH